MFLWWGAGLSYRPAQERLELTQDPEERDPKAQAQRVADVVKIRFRRRGLIGIGIKNRIRKRTHPKEGT